MSSDKARPSERWHICFGRTPERPPDHVDDHHMSIEGVEERCSRCGGTTVEVVPASRITELEQERERLREALHKIANGLVPRWEPQEYEALARSALSEDTP